MNPDIKERWVNRLLGPNTNQTGGALGRVREFGESPAGNCCLGVLCEIAVEDGVIEKHVAPSGLVLYGTPEEFSEESAESMFLPPSVYRWAGLNKDNPTVEIPDENDVCCGEHTILTTLSELNDDYKYSFAEIAALIEDQL